MISLKSPRKDTKMRDKFVTNEVIRVTEGFNLQCNKVVREVEENVARIS